MQQEPAVAWRGIVRSAGFGLMRQGIGFPWLSPATIFAAVAAPTRERQGGSVLNMSLLIAFAAPPGTGDAVGGQSGTAAMVACLALRDAETGRDGHDVLFWSHSHRFPGHRTDDGDGR